MVKLQRIRYDELNVKQQENYNFQKIRFHPCRLRFQLHQAGR